MSVRVSVVMPVYNVGLYVKEAVHSILTQSYKDFEFIIIDDASTDNTVKVIQGFCDARIKLILNKENRGLAANLNKGIRIATGEYILRMDGDDISHPERMRMQVEYLDNNPNIGVVGTWIQLFGFSNTVNQYPLDSLSCKAQLLFGVPFAHPSVAFRKADLVCNNLLYDERLTQYGEDYEMWARAARVISFSNIPEVLLRYRTFPRDCKKEAEAKRLLQGKKTRERVLKDLEIVLGEQELDIFNLLAKKQIVNTQLADFLKNSEKLLHKLIDEWTTKAPDGSSQIERCVSYHWFYICYVQTSFLAVKKYFFSDLQMPISKTNIFLLIKFCIKPIFFPLRKR